MDKEVIAEIQRLEKKLEKDPTSRIFVQLASKYLEINYLEEAIGVLSTGIAFHPTYVAARMMLGKVFLQARRIKDAKTEFEEVVRIHPENILAYKKLAFIFRELNKLGEVVRISNLILKIDPYDKETKTLLASVHDEISAMDDIGTLPVPNPVSEMPQQPSFQIVSENQMSEGSPLPADYSGPMPTPQEDPLFPKEEARPVELVELAGYHEEYHPEAIALPLNVVRLKAWLGSIQEKGVRR